jgi:hypothetical protein
MVMVMILLSAMAFGNWGGGWVDIIYSTRVMFTIA